MTLKTCLVILFLLQTLSVSIHCYIAKGSSFTMEKKLKLQMNHPHYEFTNISQYRSALFRIDPNLILDFNISNAMMKFQFEVDEDTPSLHPVFISVNQRHEQISLQLPVVRSSIRYISANQYICFLEDKSLGEEGGEILISVSTGSSQLIGFHLHVIVKTIQLKLNEVHSLVITHVSPGMIKIPFFKNVSENVVIKIASQSESCMAVGIHEPKCPVFHPEDNTLTNNKNTNWQLISTKDAEIRVHMSNYLGGFYIKLMLQDESLCGKVNGGNYRKKNVSISIENGLPMSITNGSFWIQIAIPPTFSLSIGIVIGALYLVTYACSRKTMLSCRTYNVNKSENNSISVQKFVNLAAKQKSINYGKWTIFLCLIIGIPIINQTLYYLMVSTSRFGLCSYNSVCSHTFYGIRNFNHLWSNICYIILGICFIWITLVKKVIVGGNSDQDEGIMYTVGLFCAMGCGLCFKGIFGCIYHLCPSKSQHDVMYLTIILIAICQLKISETRKPRTFSIGSCYGFLAVIFLLFNIGITFERYLSDSDDIIFGFHIVMAVIQGIFIFYASVYSIYIGYPINRFKKEKDVAEIPLRRIEENGQVSSPSRNDQPENTKFMKRFAEIPRFLWIFPKIWHWKLPKFRLERIAYVLLLLGLNGYLIYFSLTVNSSLYIFIFLGANFSLNLLYYFLMKFVFGEFTCSWKSIQVLAYFVIFLGFGAASGYYFLQNISEWNKGYQSDENCRWFQPYPFYNDECFMNILFAHTFFMLFMVLLCIDDGVDGVNRDYLMVF